MACAARAPMSLTSSHSAQRVQRVAERAESVADDALPRRLDPLVRLAQDGPHRADATAVGHQVTGRVELLDRREPPVQGRVGGNEGTERQPLEPGLDDADGRGHPVGEPVGQGRRKVGKGSVDLQASAVARRAWALSRQVNHTEVEGVVRQVLGHEQRLVAE